MIEDDYDSEFRCKGTIRSPRFTGMDRGGKGHLYGNISTFHCPGDPRGIYGASGRTPCKVSEPGPDFMPVRFRGSNQKVLSRFITGGYYERHLNRMRAVYKGKHDALLSGLKELEDMFQIRGEYAGDTCASHIKGRCRKKS